MRVKQKKKRRRKRNWRRQKGPPSLLFVRVEPPTLWLSGRFTALKFPFFWVVTVGFFLLFSSSSLFSFFFLEKRQMEGYLCNMEVIRGRPMTTKLCAQVLSFASLFF